jgi:hypothetical protein
MAPMLGSRRDVIRLLMSDWRTPWRSVPSRWCWWTMIDYGTQEVSKTNIYANWTVGWGIYAIAITEFGLLEIVRG